MIKSAVAEAKEEGFPAEVEEKEAYFMNEVARGEQLSQDGMNSQGFECVFHKSLCTFCLPISQVEELFAFIDCSNNLLAYYYWIAYSLPQAVLSIARYPG